MPRRAILYLLSALLHPLSAAAAAAAWSAPEWPLRRAVTVEFPDRPVAADDVAVADFYTGGRHVANPATGLPAVRVHAEDGRIVPSRTLMAGPGDRLRVAFCTLRGVKSYAIYFGHPKPPPVARHLEEVPPRRGAWMEMRRPTVRDAASIDQLVAAFDKAGPLIGRAVLPRIYYGINPFGPDVQVISKVTATLQAPVDGTYQFAGAASDRGALLIDGKPLLFIPNAVGDARHNAKVDLKKGPHELTFYHLNVSGEQRVTLAWMLPGQKAYEVIPAAALGTLPKVTVGPLEEAGRPLTADFRIDHVGECFYADGYVHRYRFTMQTARPLPPGAKASFEWDFGDGQTLTTTLEVIDHVYLTEGEHAVKLTIRAGQQTDSRTHRVLVSRPYERIDNPPTEIPSSAAAIVRDYDVAKMDAAQLVRAALLFQRADLPGPLERAALRLARDHGGLRAGAAAGPLVSSADELVAMGNAEAAFRVLDAVPVDSSAQPAVARRHAALLLYHAADFPRALAVVEAQLKRHPDDRVLRCLQGQALVLVGRAAEGRKVLESLTPQGNEQRRAALAGAMARSVEFHITEADPEAGEAQWERWQQQQFPADFLEGYGVLLRTRLMELRKAPEAAAKVAEAFALAVPRSSYAPRLLDRAAKLLEKSDPAKSQSLRQLLKQRYPEDPLSQDVPPAKAP